jgi:WD40 repeat protein
MKRRNKILLAILAVLVLSLLVNAFVYPGMVFWVDIFWGRMIDFNVFDRSADWFGYTVAVDWSADGKTIATAGYYPYVFLWDPMTGALEKTLKGHEKWLEMVKYSPDGKWLATGDWDNRVIVWDAETGEQKHVIDVENADEMIGFAFHPTMPVIIVSSLLTGQKVVVDFETKQIVKEFRMDGAMDISYAPDGQTLLVAGFGETENTKLLLTSTFEKIGAFIGHEGVVSAVYFLDGGAKVLSCGDDATVRLWETATKKEIRRWSNNQWWVVYCAPLPDEKHFLTADPDGAIRKWAMNQDAPINTWKLHKDWATCVRASRDGRYFASTGKDGLVVVYDMQEDRIVSSMRPEDHYEQIVF